MPVLGKHPVRLGGCFGDEDGESFFFTVEQLKDES